MDFIIVGCGRIGSGLAKHLVKKGHSVVVVDKEPSSFERLGENFPGRTIVGVGFDHDVLMEAGIGSADGLAAVTSSDEVNVIASKIARDIFRVPKVVTRLFDIHQSEIYERLGIQTVNPVAWGINRISELLLNTQFEVVCSVGSGDVELLEAAIPALMVGKTVRDHTLVGELIVVGITRDNQTFIPTLGTVFTEGDIVHLAIHSNSAAYLMGQFGY